MTYVPSDFGSGKSGPQILWYRWRLAVHGFLSDTPRPLIEWSEADVADTQRLQLAQGWKGTQPGGGADGLPGFKTLAVMLAEPRQVIDLSIWKLTLPVDENRNGSPDEVYPIGAFQKVPWFSNGPRGVTFVANCGGATTPNSSYPRCELREMTPAGGRASWSSSTGVHEMTLEQAIMHLPVVKPEVVCAQVHDAVDDVLMVRLEGRRLFVESGGREVGLLDDNYVLGTRFKTRIVASSGVFSVFYNDERDARAHIARSVSGCYFKAGCYTQSNVSKGDAPDAFGEVLVYALSVAHR